jgi:ABC-2 type transport system ATP-binding protein
MDATKPLVVKNLTKYYGTFCAVKDASFEVHPGEIFGLLGPNGAGKTTIISTITTLEDPSEGSVSVFGYDVLRASKHAKLHLGCVPQELINHGFFTVEEILHIHSGYYSQLRNGEYILYLLNRLGLYEHRHKNVKALSGGLKRRLLIAKALVHKPRLLLLDEPTAGVDIELRAILWDFICELRDQGVSVLLTTHYLEEAERLCDRVGIIDNGVLKHIGKTSDLISALTHREVMLTLNHHPTAITHENLVSHGDRHLTFHIPYTKNIGELIQELAIDITSIHDIKIREGNLEDAFQKVVNDKR